MIKHWLHLTIFLFTMTNIFSLSGKRALITGATQGLGFALAQGLAENGAQIIINARNTQKLDNAIETFKQKNIDVKGYIFDVTDGAAILTQIDLIEQQIGPIDILINNAGIIKRQPLEDMSDDDFLEVLNTNLAGVFRVSKVVARKMIERKQGKIINMCSMMSELGRPNVGAYAASKGGLKMLTKNMATEWAKHNIQVNGIGPGYFITELTQALQNDEKFNTFITTRTPAGRWGKPEELVGAAVFLASGASNFVNGHIIYVDGGILATL